MQIIPTSCGLESVSRAFFGLFGAPGNMTWMKMTERFTKRRCVHGRRAKGNVATGKAQDS